MSKVCEFIHEKLCSRESCTAEAQGVCGRCLKAFCAACGHAHFHEVAEPQETKTTPEADAPEESEQ